ncbi:MAG: RDD family protein [Planctomycetes bacterium]|nr:RDD family protein [Planctomycetota bacterium]
MNPKLGYGYIEIQDQIQAFRDTLSQISASNVKLAIAFLFVLGLIKVWIEGRSGLTLGKWLMGLRTTRDTLAPAGFARALTKNLLYFVDLYLFVSPLPAAISIMLSNKNQTIGDRISNTVVIRANSIQLREH